MALRAMPPARPYVRGLRAAASRTRGSPAFGRRPGRNRRSDRSRGGVGSRVARQRRLLGAQRAGDRLQPGKPNPARHRSRPGARKPLRRGVKGQGERGPARGGPRQASPGSAQRLRQFLVRPEPCSRDLLDPGTAPVEAGPQRRVVRHVRGDAPVEPALDAKPADTPLKGSPDEEPLARGHDAVAAGTLIGVAFGPALHRVQGEHPGHGDRGQAARSEAEDELGDPHRALSNVAAWVFLHEEKPPALSPGA
jgi:hypothetical protein